MPTPDHLPTADAPLAEVSPVTTTVHHPGQPLVTQADADAQVDDLQLKSDGPIHVAEYDGIDTTSPAANLATRSNVVPQ